MMDIKFDSNFIKTVSEMSDEARNTFCSIASVTASKLIKQLINDIKEINHIKIELSKLREDRDYWRGLARDENGVLYRNRCEELETKLPPDQQSGSKGVFE